MTKEIKLPVEKLWVTIYATDDEAFDVWHDHIGLPKERIIRIDSNDNFWSMGDTGPCGPCTEIFMIMVKMLQEDCLALQMKMEIDISRSGI